MILGEFAIDHGFAAEEPNGEDFGSELERDLDIAHGGGFIGFGARGGGVFEGQCFIRGDVGEAVGVAEVE